MRGSFVRIVFLTSTFMLAACGGQNSSFSTPATMPIPATSPKNVGVASITIRVPARATSVSARRPAYVSASTQSLVIAVDGVNGTPVNLTTGSPNCMAATSTTPLTCTAQIPVSAGSHTFAFTTFDATGGTGHQLSTASLTKMIVANTLNSLSVVLTGIPVAIQVSGPAGSTGIVGNQTNGLQFLATTQQTITVTASDAGGNVIIGPGAPTLTANVSGPSANSGITAAAVAGSANQFTVSSTGYGNGDLVLTATSPIGPAVTANVEISATTSTTVLVGGFSLPEMSVFDSHDGNIYVPDYNLCTIVQVSPTLKSASAIAGSTLACSVLDGTGSTARFDLPKAIAFDSTDNNLYVYETCDVRRVNPATNQVTGISGSMSSCAAFADGSSANAQFGAPGGITFDSVDGNLYASDNGNCAIRQINPTTGNVVTLDQTTTKACGYGDGVGGNVHFNNPAGIAFDPTHNVLYVADAGNCVIRQINTASGALFATSTIAGLHGTCGFKDGTGSAALFNNPQGLVYDTQDGNIYVADFGNCDIRQVNPSTGTVITVAGAGTLTTTPGVCGATDGFGLVATYGQPAGLAFDSFNFNLYVSDTNYVAIRELRL